MIDGHSPALNGFLLLQGGARRAAGALGDEVACERRSGANCASLYSTVSARLMLRRSCICRASVPCRMPCVPPNIQRFHAQQCLAVVELLASGSVVRFCQVMRLH